MKIEITSLLVSTISAVIAIWAVTDVRSTNQITTAAQLRSTVILYETELAKYNVSLACWGHFAKLNKEEIERTLSFTEDLKNRFSRSSGFEKNSHIGSPEFNIKAAMRFASELREATYSYHSELALLKARIAHELREEAIYVCGV